MNNNLIFATILIALGSLCNNTNASQTYNDLHNTWELQQIYEPGNNHKENFKKYKDLLKPTLKREFFFGDSAITNKTIGNILEKNDDSQFKSTFKLDEETIIVSQQTSQELKKQLVNGAMIIVSKTEPNCYGTITSILSSIISIKAALEK